MKFVIQTYFTCKVWMKYEAIPREILWMNAASNAERSQKSFQSHCVLCYVARQFPSINF